MPEFSVSMPVFEGKIITRKIEARGWISAIREFIKLEEEKIKLVSDSRVQFKIRDIETGELRYYDAYFCWEHDTFECYRIERAG